MSSDVSRTGLSFAVRDEAVRAALRVLLDDQRTDLERQLAASVVVLAVERGELSLAWALAVLESMGNARPFL